LEKSLCGETYCRDTLARLLVVKGRTELSLGKASLKEKTQSLRGYLPLSA